MGSQAQNETSVLFDILYNFKTKTIVSMIKLSFYFYFPC